MTRRSLYLNRCCGLFKTQQFLGLPPGFSSRLYDGICAKHGSREMTFTLFIEAMSALVDMNSITSHPQTSTSGPSKKLLMYLDQSGNGFGLTDLAEILSALATAAVMELRALNDGSDKSKPNFIPEDVSPTSPRISLLANQIMLESRSPSSNGSRSISAQQLQNWINNHALYIAKPLQDSMDAKLLQAIGSASQPEALSGNLCLPIVHGESDILTDAMIWILASFIPPWEPAANNVETEGQARWEVLFSARRDVCYWFVGIQDVMIVDVPCDFLSL